MPANPNNNSFATATALTGITSSATPPSLGSLSASDLVDYYSFKLSGTSNNLQLSLTGLTGNAKLSVFDKNQQPVPISTSNTGTLSEAVILNNLSAGDYYVKVDLEAGATSADYKLSVLASSALVTNTVLWRDQANSTFVSWQLNGTTVSGASSNIPVPSNYILVGSGDLNADGIGDLLWRDLNPASAGYGQVVIWWMDGINLQTGSAALKFGGGSEIKVGVEWQVVGIKDLDGNNTADLLWRNSQTGDLATWFIAQNQNDKSPVYAGGGLLPVKLPESSGWDLVGLENIDGLNGADLLWRNRFSGQVAIWTIDGSGTSLAQATIVAQVDPNYKIVGFKDLNGDNKADVVWRNNNTSEVYIWRMNGTTLDQFARYLVPTSYQVSQLADLNGDGRNDLVWRNETGGETYIWLMGTDGLTIGDGSGAVTFNGTTIRVGSSFEILGARDFSGDGKADLLWRDKSSGSAYAWVMDGIKIVTPDLLTNNGQGIGVSYKLPSLNYVNYQETQFLGLNISSQTLNFGGSTAPQAFDIGILLGEGSYRDTVTLRDGAAAQDFYKFSINAPTVFTMGVDNTSVQLQLLDSNFSLVNYSAGMQLLNLGTYYIKASAGTSGLLNYKLDVKGEPVVINLLGTNFTVDAAIDLPEVPDGQTPKPQGTVNSSFTVRNEGTVQSGSFKVKYYISRDQNIDASDVFLDEVTISSLGARQEQILTRTLTLPAGDDRFSWNIDGTYYIGTIIDPVDANNPDGSVKESDETDNLNRGVGLDKGAIEVTNVQTSELVGKSMAVTSTGTFAPESTITVQFEINNLGRRGTDKYSDVLGLYFILSADPTIDPAAGSESGDYLIVAVDDFGNPFPALYELAAIGAAPSKTQPATSGLQTVRFTLPEANNVFWNQFQSGLQTVYIGVVIDQPNAIPEPNENNNYGTALGVDFASFQVDLQPQSA